MAQAEEQRNRQRILMEAQGSRGVVAREQRGEGGVDRIVAGLHVHRLAGHAVQFAARLQESGDAVVRAEAHRGIERLVQIQQVAVAERGQMAHDQPDAGLVVDAHGGGEPLRGRVDADERDPRGVESPDFGRGDGERRDDDRVRVAAHRQFVEELLARARVADRLDDQIVAGRSQHFVEAFDDARGEPVELAAAHQQRHAVGAARFEDAGHAGYREVELLGGLHHLGARFGGDHVRAGERAGDRGGGDACLPGDVLDAGFHGPSRFFKVDGVTNFSSL